MREEGLGALWKGALPRACWTAPLGAMNFAGAVWLQTPCGPPAHTGIAPFLFKAQRSWQMMRLSGPSHCMLRRLQTAFTPFWVTFGLR